MEVRRLKGLCLFWFGAMVVLAQQSMTWVPYSARYTDVVNETARSGHPVIHEQKLGEEIRSSDGSRLKTVVVAGQRTTGELWQWCGQIFVLDYAQKKATFRSTSPRKHPYLPPDTPQGTMALGGLEFLAYPIHMAPESLGTGTVWINMDQDIAAKIEIHLKLPNGGHRDSIMTLTSLDLNSPIDDSLMKIPADFAIEKGKTSSSVCSSSSAGS
jgi:hypothetical protein